MKNRDEKGRRAERKGSEEETYQFFQQMPVALIQSNFHLLVFVGFCLCTCSQRLWVARSVCNRSQKMNGRRVCHTAVVVIAQTTTVKVIAIAVIVVIVVAGLAVVITHAHVV